MCHQCQRNDKGRVVRCKKCRTKRFCVHCIENWYAYICSILFISDCCVDYGIMDYIVFLFCFFYWCWVMFTLHNLLC